MPLAALLVLEMAFNWGLTQFDKPCHASSDPHCSGLGPLALGALFEAAPHVGRSFQRVRGDSVCNIFPPWMSGVHCERPAAADFVLGSGKGKMADEFWLMRRQAFHRSARVLVAQAREYTRQPPGDVQEMADGRIFYRHHPARIVTNLVRPHGVQQEG